MAPVGFKGVEEVTLARTSRERKRKCTLLIDVVVDILAEESSGFDILPRVVITVMITLVLSAGTRDLMDSKNKYTRNNIKITQG